MIDRKSVSVYEFEPRVKSHEAARDQAIHKWRSTHGIGEDIEVTTVVERNGDMFRVAVVPEQDSIVIVGVIDGVELTKHAKDAFNRRSKGDVDFYTAFEQSSSCGIDSVSAKARYHEPSDITFLISHDQTKTSKRYPDAMLNTHHFTLCDVCEREYSPQDHDDCPYCGALRLTVGDTVFLNGHRGEVVGDGDTWTHVETEDSEFRVNTRNWIDDGRIMYEAQEQQANGDYDDSEHVIIS